VELVWRGAEWRASLCVQCRYWAANIAVVATANSDSTIT
jgi:hypothetical protein